jgi:hypothetical protein
MIDKHEELLKNLKEHMPELEKMLERASEHWCYEDFVYRFYHYSFKVYWVQCITKEIVELLRKMSPDSKINEWFEQIFEEGTGKEWEQSHNKDWLKHTRPIVEAYLHAKYFIEMAVKYGKELDEAPHCLPSGWAGLLYFYNLR